MPGIVTWRLCNFWVTISGGCTISGYHNPEVVQLSGNNIRRLHNIQVLLPGGWISWSNHESFYFQTVIIPFKLNIHTKFFMVDCYMPWLMIWRQKNRVIWGSFLRLPGIVTRKLQIFLWISPRKLKYFLKYLGMLI